MGMNLMDALDATTEFRSRESDSEIAGPERVRESVPSESQNDKALATLAKMMGGIGV